MPLRKWYPPVARVVATAGMAIAGLATIAVGSTTAAQAAPSCSPPSSYSEKWAGIIDYCNTYYLASGRFTTGCGTGQAGSIIGFFAGLGGVYPGSRLIDTAVEDIVTSADGVHHFRAFAETGGGQRITITPPGGIHCGDKIFLGVTQFSQPWNDGNQLYQIYNETTGQHTNQYVTRSAAWPGTDGSTAEFIIDRPTFNAASDPDCPYAPLTKWTAFPPIPHHLTTSYFGTVGVHADVSITSTFYTPRSMYSCDGTHVLEEPHIAPQYNDMWMYWRSAF